jgi:hypothetical protein
MMNGTETFTQESEFIMRRLNEGVPSWGLLFPALFALVVLFVVLFFRQPLTVGDLLKRAHVSRMAAGLLGLVWFIGLVGLIGLRALFSLVLRNQTLDPGLFLGLAAPIIAFPVLLGVFIAIMLCIVYPRYLIPVGLVVGGCVAYMVGGSLFLPYFGWWVVLVPVLGLALFYVVLMYFRDAHSINAYWAGFLGLCRCAVYCTLAAVFLLPGCQTFQTSETHSKVLVLFDVSGSMDEVDDVPVPGQNPSTLLSRRQKVVKLLTDAGDGGKDFMDRVQLVSPATLYRFGAVLDDVELQQFLAGKHWDKAQWVAWLNPDSRKVVIPEKIGEKFLKGEEREKQRMRLQNLYDDLQNGTNVAGAALQAVVRETGHLIQAVIIVSDGRSNLGSGETFRELRARALSSKRPFHIITIGVGEHRQPVSIYVQDLEAPQQARPDDKFPVRVRLTGDGLPDEPFTVTLEAIRVTKKGDRWEPNPGEKWTLVKEGKFSAAGEHPQGEVEFPVDVRDLRGIKPNDDSKDDLVEGTWEFRARVPRHRLEAFSKAEHESKRPARVVVQKRPLRVLLFAGGPNRDYQFLRTLFYREVKEHRMELSIFLQTAPDKDVDQDVESERLLTRFPDRAGAEDIRDRHHNLNEYDVIIAFDPDWSLLTDQQLRLLEEWVSKRAGGLIFVAGPVNTYHLARPGGQDIKPLLNIMPVTVKDSRLHGLGIGHDTSRPYSLNFPDKAKQFEFLKIDEEAKEPMEGWDKFFWGEAGKPEPGKDLVPRNGMYNYYPVEKVKPAAEVLATFATSEPAARINDGKDEQPYLVKMRYGNGMTVYISSAEIWRLRQFKNAYFQVFWVKLARYAGSGNLGKLSSYGRFTMQSTVRTGLVKVEAQILGLDLQPLPRDSRPKVLVVRPPDFDPKTDRETPEFIELKAKAKEGDWNGYFIGTFPVHTPGDYTLKIPIPGTAQTLTHDLAVERPNLEKAVTRPDHGHLYQLATSARPILARLPEDRRADLLKVLRVPANVEKEAGENAPPAATENKDDARLYFPLASAGMVPGILTQVPPTKESTKGRLQDLWDMGFESGWSIRADYFIMLALAAIGLLGFAILMFIRRWIFAVSFLAGAAVVAGVVGLVTLAYEPNWAILPLDMSFVLGIIVGLLATEWLTRKLLKLA